MKTLTVATRSGLLALAQTQIVIAALKKVHPGMRIEIKTVTTKGDRDRHTALWNLKGTGFFTSQLEDTLLAGKADFAVHSFKDLPTEMRDGLIIAAVCDRQFSEDCLVGVSPVDSIDELPKKVKVGTSSLRRISQLKHLRPDIEVVPVRGNVKTRLKKLDAGDFDAIILARAGLERLNLDKRISLVFDPVEFIPAPAQGALAVQTRAADTETNEIVSAIDDANARKLTFAERKVLSQMQCGCHAPLGVFAQITGTDIRIHAFISDLEGKNFVKRQISGPGIESNTLSEKLAKDLLASGGRDILSELSFRT